MTWMLRLHETYEAGLRLDLPNEQQLPPLHHTFQNAHIRVVLDVKGEFRRADVLEKVKIVLPATESSAGRSGTDGAAHPLSDKVRYLAGDYSNFGGLKKSFYEKYLKQLSKWVESEYSHPKLVAVRNYVRKGRLVEDLVAHGVMHVDENNLLLTSWPENASELPKLFKVLPKEKGKLEQGDAMVCWAIEKSGDPVSDTWKDPELHAAWTGYESSNSHQFGFCSLLGEIVSVAENHPAKLRHTGDKAKLISSNDNAGFTFRGRFLSADHSAQVGAVATQKAHSALRWLIERQGFRNGDQVIVSWAVSGCPVPNPMQDSWAFLDRDFAEISAPVVEEFSDHSTDNRRDLGQFFASALSKRMAGYQAKLPPSDHVIIMGLDSATPGRMAVTYYQEFSPQEFIQRITMWHQDFAWFQRRAIERMESGGNAGKQATWVVGAPAPKIIASAVFGENISESLKKQTVARLLTCIIEGAPLPKDLADNAFRRAISRYSYPKDQQWLWESNLGVACSLVKGFNKRNRHKPEEYAMALDENRHSRDYLFGRLLAIAEKIEEVALHVADEDRSTTAARLMQRFANHPASTWRSLELALVPYKQRLKTNRPGFLHIHQRLIGEVMNKFELADFINDKPLSGEFLLAFHVQRIELNKKSASVSDTEAQTEERGIKQ